MNKDARTKGHPITQSSKSNAAARERKEAERAASAAMKTARRAWIVFLGLAGGLGATGALLMVMAPKPLMPDAPVSLYATGSEVSLDQLFDTPTQIKPGRWRQIYIHQSLTSSGNAMMMGDSADGMSDHFLIGNGDQLADGAIQTSARWSRQLDAGAMPGAEIAPDCVSVCLVGDFNRVRPSPTQQARLVDLILALQKQLNIDSAHVIFGADSAQSTNAGVGTRFPTGLIRAQLSQ